MSHEARLLLLLLLLLVGCSAPVQPSPSTTTQLSTSVRGLEAGQVVDGVPCLTEETPVHHTHVHLQVLLDGADVTVPAGIGVGRPWGVDATGIIATGACFAWLHVHDTSGVVHITTPEQKTFTMGQLFEVWGQPLGEGSALGYHGSVVVLVNGRRVDGDPRAVILENLENIVLELGKPPAVAPPALYDFGATRS
jgi:hypothetical protein